MDGCAEEPFADTGTTDDDEVLAAIIEYTKTRKLKWTNGSKKVRASRHTKELVEQLLNPDPSKRLGMGPEGADEIRNHSYFSKFDWAALRSKTMSVPPEWCPDPKLCSTVRNVRLYFREFSDEN
jgi:serine/threonine protein kinase